MPDKPAQLRIPIDRAALTALCQKWHITRLSLFGSVLRDDFRPDSDVDVLIQFEPGHTPGWEIVDLGEELSALLGGHYVDLLNPRYLDRRIREPVLRSAVVQYEAPPCSVTGPPLRRPPVADVAAGGSPAVARWQSRGVPLPSTAKTPPPRAKPRAPRGDDQ
jgi:predicted nucleotidyltransferase